MRVDWTTFKGFVDDRGVSIQYIDINDAYYMKAFDSAFSLECKVQKETPASTDQADFEDNYQSGSNKKLDKRTALQEAMPVAIHKPELTSFSRATHDFTNKCTWYNKSTEVTGETLTLDTGNTYDFANANLIDVVNGIVNRQDLLQATYSISIYENGSPATTGYTIDHVNGKVTFDAAPTTPITADYHYATTSEWSVKPDAGKMLLIEHSEVQFSDDVNMNTPFVFEVWIDNPYFAVVGHPLEGIPRITAEKVQYNSLRDIINESNLGYEVPAMISIGKPVIVFPFNYVTVKPLYSSYNAELVVRAVNDTAIPGTYATATFYLISKDES